MIFFLIALGASVIGAISGVGGGVIIKPVLDLVTSLEAGTISLLSSCTVFFMAVSSILKHLYDKTRFQRKTAVFLGIGGVAGGYAGEGILSMAGQAFLNDTVMKQIQNILLFTMLFFVMLYLRKGKGIPTYRLTNPVLIALTGVALGGISTFIGIGGGPINVVALTLLFSMDTKEAAVNSLILILFSQASKLLTAFADGNLMAQNLTPLLYMIPAGIAGGILGSRLNRTLSKEKIAGIFQMVLIFTMAVSAINIMKL